MGFLHCWLLGNFYEISLKLFLDLNVDLSLNSYSADVWGSCLLLEILRLLTLRLLGCELHSYLPPELWCLDLVLSGDIWVKISAIPFSLCPPKKIYFFQFLFYHLLKLRTRLGSDISCCVGLAEWESVLTFKTALMSALKHTDSVAIITALRQQEWTWNNLRMLKWLTCIWYTGLWMEIAPAHISLAVRNDLRATFGNRWFGRGSPVGWPPRLPDLTCLDFFLWMHMKQLVYETLVQTEDLVARITVAAGTIADMPGTFERTRQSMIRRCTASIQIIHWSRIRAVPVNVTTVISMLN